MTQLRSSRSRNTRREFCSLHVWIRTWRALHCQSLKHKLKKCDLRLRSKERKLSAWWTASGKLFHTTGPATEKALLPNFLLVYVEQSLIQLLDIIKWVIGLSVCICACVSHAAVLYCLSACLYACLSACVCRCLCFYQVHFAAMLASVLSSAGNCGVYHV